MQLTLNFQIPQIIGFVGNPKAGKSTAQELLQVLAGHEPINDGDVLRRFCIDWLGMSYDDVYSQEGKAGYVEILGKTWQRRDILGTLGKQLEDMFGEHIMPYVAFQKLDMTGRYSFGSVRKTQGHFYRERGGIIIEIRNPLAKPSGYDFDKFDPASVDYVIDNDGQARGLSADDSLWDLTEKLAAVLSTAASKVAA